MTLGRTAAEASWLGAAVVELATGHADGARGAESAANARGYAALTQLVLVGDLATEAAAHKRSEAKASKAHHAVVRVGNAVNGVALATYLAGEAEPRVEALRNISETSEGRIHVGHGEEALGSCGDLWV